MSTGSLSVGSLLIAIVLAAVGSVGFWEFVRFLLSGRTRRTADRKTTAEADLLFAQAGTQTLEGAFKLITSLQNRQCELEQRLDAQGQKIDQQEGEISTLQTTVHAYAERVAYLMTGIAQLLKQISGSGQPPCWQPDEWHPPEDGHE